MRDLKLIVIILLLFLLLVSLGGIYYFYQQNLTIEKKQNEIVSVYVAKNNISANSIIKEKDLKLQKLQKTAVPFKIVIKSEIVGKYATVPIFKDEPIRPEKISKLVKKKDANSTAKLAKHDLYNISSKLFRNPNYMLKSGDLIDIVGVWQENGEFVVKYIANSAEVYGFLFRGVLEEKAIKKVEKTTIDKKSKKKVKTVTNRYADEFLIDTDEDIITSIIEAHNKGDQLWMVMSGKDDKAKVLDNIKKSLVAPKKVLEVKKIVKKRVYKKSYPTASITYGANEQKRVSTWK